ncbi:peroxiredoxin family protein [Streptomyces chryseus]|uniref:peroxiredoxin family protein n=1 Tax=Streptomyces chryseus TaxID=68186 RepID=UPI0031FC64B6
MGDHVGDFALPGGVGVGACFERRDFTLCQQRGSVLILAFYRGADSSVCAQQMCSYSSSPDLFTDSGARVWGISPESVDSSARFALKHGLRVPLLSDPGRHVARSFGVETPGAQPRRAVFVIAPDGTLVWKYLALSESSFPPPAVLARHLARVQRT